MCGKAKARGQRPDGEGRQRPMCVRARACLRVLRMGEGIPSEAGCQLHSSMRVHKGRQAAQN